MNEPEDGKHKIASVSYSIPATFDGTTTIAAVTNRAMTVDVDGNYTIPMDSTYNNITINVTYTNATYPLYFDVADGSPEVAGVTLSNLVNLDGLEQDEDGNYLLVYNPGTGIYGARLTATPANGVSFTSTVPTIFADLDGDDVNDNSSETITNGGT